MAPPLTNLQYQAIFALLQSGNQVTLTQVRTALDTHVQNSSDEQFEALPGGGYKPDANTGFESSIGAYDHEPRNCVNFALTRHILQGMVKTS